MDSLDSKFTKLLRELIQHEVNVITDSDWFQENVDAAVEVKTKEKHELELDKSFSELMQKDKEELKGEV